MNNILQYKYNYNIIKNHQDIPNQTFKFTFVRNPYSRILSAFLNKIIQNPKEEFLKSQFLNSVGVNFKVEDNIRTFLFFLKFLSNWKGLSEEHVQPQHLIAQPDLIKYDFIGRFESLHDDYKYLQKKLEIDLPFPTHKDVHFPPTHATDLLNKYYSKEALEIVERIYEKDFQTFGY